MSAPRPCPLPGAAGAPPVTGVAVVGSEGTVHRRPLLGASGSGPALAKRPLEFHCGCSRERVHRAPLELEDLLAKEGQAEATCEFCTTRYVIPGEELRTLIDAASPR